MAWIELHQGLREHPKTKKLARLLGVRKAHAAGMVMFLWLWALDYAQNGDLSSYDAFELADACDWEGDPQVFIEALITCGKKNEAGFLERVNDTLVVHDWLDYAGRLLDLREGQAAKQKRKRDLYMDYELIYAVRARDGDSCRYCNNLVDFKDRKSAKGGTYDHVDPDGGNSFDNIVVACRSCNSSKGRRTPDQANMRLLPVAVRAESVENLSGICPKPALPNQTKPNLTRPEDRAPAHEGAAPPSELENEPTIAEPAPSECSPWGRSPRWVPGDLALLVAATAGTLIEPERLPIRIGHGLNLRATEERNSMAVRDAWYKMPPAELAAWCQKAMAMAVEKGKDPHKRLELAVGIIARALESGGNLLEEGKEKGPDGAKVVPMARPKTCSEACYYGLDDFDPPLAASVAAQKARDKYGAPIDLKTIDALFLAGGKQAVCKLIDDAMAAGKKRQASSNG